jgi:hypothetical protein
MESVAKLKTIETIMYYRHHRDSKPVRQIDNYVLSPAFLLTKHQETATITGKSRMAGGMAARRRRGPAGKRPPLLLTLLLLLVVMLPTRGVAQRCDHSTGDALLERLEATFGGVSPFPRHLGDPV